MKYSLRITRFLSESLQPREISPRRLVVMCVVVFVVAVSVRLLHWQNSWLTIDYTMSRTAAGYKKEAQFLSDGDLHSFIRGRSAEADSSLLTHTPGYPIFIAFVNALTGNSNVVLRLVHIALGATATVLVLLIGIELLPFGAAIVAALFAGLSPQLSYYSCVLLPDSILALPLLAGVYLLLRARKRPKAWRIIGAGVFAGIACWLRADVFLLAPFLCLMIPFLFPRKKILRYVVLVVTASVLTISPITIRNLVVFKSFVPTTLGMGTNLIEGIADYDPGKNFDLEKYDHEIAQREAALYNRPDYAEDLYRSDGVGRERLRVARARAVISANKLWFAQIMVRRAGRMLAYEQVPIISTEPSISHPLDVSRGELTWHSESSGVNDFATEPINVVQNSDYVLGVSLKGRDGRTSIKVVRPDTNKTLGSATVPDSLNPSAAGTDKVVMLQIPFVNSSANQVKIVIAKLDNNAIEIGPLDLYRLGAASYLWTRYFRVAVKPLQKFFTTERMLPLALAGVVLLALARRLDALSVILAIPLYYVTTHAPIHLELRYVLPLQYFWALLVATSLYLIWVVGLQVFPRSNSSDRIAQS